MGAVQPIAITQITAALGPWVARYTPGGSRIEVWHFEVPGHPVTAIAVHDEGSRQVISDGTASEVAGELSRWVAVLGAEYAAEVGYNES